LTAFWWENPREGDHLEDPGVDERIILKWIFERGIGLVGMDSIEQAKDRDTWRAVVNAVMNLRGFIKYGKFHN
jgi:hypothetical protein